MRVQTIALLSVATLAPSAAGVVLPRADLNSPRRFPLNNTIVANSPDDNTTRLPPESLSTSTSTSTSTPTSQVETSSNQVLLSTETTETVSLETTSDSSFSQETESFLTAARLDPDSSHSSTSTRAVPSTHESFSESYSSHLSQVVSEPIASTKDNIDSTTATSNQDEDASRVETKDSVRASAQRKPHQKIAHSLTKPNLNGTNTCGSNYNSPCGWIPSITSKGNGTYTPGPRSSGTLTVISPTSLEPCTTLQDNEPITEYSIVYTATVTFFGNRSEYTPPYPTISTPNFCETLSPAPTLSAAPSGTPEEPGSKPLPGVGISYKRPGKICSPGDSCAPDKAPGWSNPTEVPEVPEAPNPKEPGATFSSTRMTVTFVTTDKNPAIVFPTEPPPRFNRPTNGGGLRVSDKQRPEPSNAPVPDRPELPGDHNSAKPQSQAQPETLPQPTSESKTQGRPQGGPNAQPQPEPKPDSEPVPAPIKTFAVTARGQEVIVNDKTFTSLKPDQSTTITVDYGTFTIRPTEVVGEGATVKKPQPVGTAVSVVTPTSATIAKVPVTVSGTEAIIGGTKLKIPLMGTTTRLKVPVVGSNTLVEERQVSLAPGRAVVDEETLTYRGVGGPQTDVIIEGGEMVTAVGKSILVFHSTTLTYGPGIPEIMKTIDDDTVTVAPAGVIIKGTTLGGSEAEMTNTKYQIVGGATITKVNPSYVIIDETTFTAGPGAKRTSKVAGGETITIGSRGITIGEMTVKYPFGASTVTTIKAKATASDKLPVATGTNNKAKDGKDKGDGNKANDDSGATSQYSSLTMGITGLCIAVGVWILF